MFGQFLPECGAVGAPPLAPPAGAVVVAPEEPVEPVEPVVAALAIRVVDGSIERAAPSQALTSS
jgi:hypothetical protein